MLKIVEFGLLAVSLLIVLALIVASPRGPEPAPSEAVDPELPTKLQP
jgi:hypothetical protein